MQQHLFKAFLEITTNPAQSGVANWIGMFVWFRDWLGNSITFALGFGAAAGISLGLMFQSWIRQTGSIFVGLFTGLAAGVAISFYLKPVFGIYDSWMFLLPVALMMVSRATASMFSPRSLGDGHGGYFLLIFGAVVLTELALIKALVYHEDKLPVGRPEKLCFVSTYAALFLFSYLQPFRLLSYLLEDRKGKSAQDPFALFGDSAAHWGPWIESLNLPMPYLADWLFVLLKRDRKRGMAEVLFIAGKYPSQLQAVDDASLRIIAEDLKGLTTLEKIARANEVLEYIPAEVDCLSNDLIEVLQRVSNISYSVQDYRYAETTAERLEVLRQLQEKITAFHDEMAVAKPPLNTNFQPIAVRWLEVAKTAEAVCRLQKERVGNKEWKA